MTQVRPMPRGHFVLSHTDNFLDMFFAIFKIFFDEKEQVMKMKLSKIFFIIAGIMLAAAFGLFVAHTYFGEEYIMPGRNLLPPSSHFLNDHARRFNVAVISDSGTHNIVLERVIDAARRESDPAFIMYVGDLVSDRRPANFYWMLHEIERHLAGLPFYMIPGNHDVEKRGNIDKRFYRSVMGPGYYWFGYGNTLFIAMDSSDKIEDAQFEWLSDTLNNVRPLFKNCIIFSHMPPMNPAAAERHRMGDADAERFASVIRGHDINAIITGHVHYFSHETFAGIPLYTTPSSGQTARFTDKGRFGYISLDIGPNGIQKITPKYIEFSGPKREYLEAWFVRYVFTQRVRELVNVVFVAALVFFAAGIITRIYTRRRKNCA